MKNIRILTLLALAAPACIDAPPKLPEEKKLTIGIVGVDPGPLVSPTQEVKLKVQAPAENPKWGLYVDGERKAAGDGDTLSAGTLASGQHVLRAALHQDDTTEVEPPVRAETVVLVTGAEAITILSPKDDAVVPYKPLEVTVFIQNYVLDPDNVGGTNSTGHGHWHLYIDNVYSGVNSATAKATLADAAKLKPGAHKIYGQLHNNDHIPLAPAVKSAEVDLTVTAPAIAISKLSQGTTEYPVEEDACESLTNGTTTFDCAKIVGGVFDVKVAATGITLAAASATANKLGDAKWVLYKRPHGGTDADWTAVGSARGGDVAEDIALGVGTWDLKARLLQVDGTDLPGVDPKIESAAVVVWSPLPGVTFDGPIGTEASRAVVDRIFDIVIKTPDFVNAAPEAPAAANAFAHGHLHLYWDTTTGNEPFQDTGTTTGAEDTYRFDDFNSGDLKNKHVAVTANPDEPAAASKRLGEHKLIAVLAQNDHTETWDDDLDGGTAAVLIEAETYVWVGPHLTIVSPAEGDPEWPAFDVELAVQNFSITADGHIHVVVESDAPIMVTDPNDLTAAVGPLTQGAHTITASLVTSAHAALDPPVERTVHVNVKDPQITPRTLDPVTRNDLGVAFAGHTIIRATGSWIGDNYVVGGTVTMSDSENGGANDSTDTIAAVTHNTLTVTSETFAANADDSTADFSGAGRALDTSTNSITAWESSAFAFSIAAAVPADFVTNPTNLALQANAVGQGAYGILLDDDAVVAQTGDANQVLQRIVPVNLPGCTLTCLQVPGFTHPHVTRLPEDDTSYVHVVLLQNDGTPVPGIFPRTFKIETASGALDIAFATIGGNQIVPSPAGLLATSASASTTFTEASSNGNIASGGDHKWKLNAIDVLTGLPVAALALDSTSNNVTGNVTDGTYVVRAELVERTSGDSLAPPVYDTVLLSVDL